MTFSFYQGGDEKTGSGVLTDWVMREYRINHPEMGELTLCQIYDACVAGVSANAMKERIKRGRELEEESDDDDDDDEESDDEKTNSIKRVCRTTRQLVPDLAAEIGE